MNGGFVGERLSSGRPPEPLGHEPGAPLRPRGGQRVRVAVYFLGLAIILSALAWAAVLLGVPEEWIGVGSLLGVGVILIKGTRYGGPSPR